MTERIKLYLKSEPAINERGVAIGVYQDWVTAEGEVVSPRTCFKCEEGIYEGHTMTETGNTYCNECFAERYTAQQREEMYDNDEQYYTVWDESDIDDTKYELVEE